MIYNNKAVWIICLLVQACSQEKPKSKVFTQQIEDTISKPLLTPEIPIIEIQPIKIDSSRKAFDDIYFGISSEQKTFSNQKTIGNHNFTFRNEKYDSEYGLWNFSLEGQNVFNDQELQVVLKDLHSVISAKYPYQSITEICENCGVGGNARFAVMTASASGNSFPPLPSDIGSIIYTTEYNGNNKLLKMGYEICYEPRFAKKKVFYSDGTTGSKSDFDNLDGFDKYLVPKLDFIEVKTSRILSNQKTGELNKKLKDDQKKF